MDTKKNVAIPVRIVSLKDKLHFNDIKEVISFDINCENLREYSSNYTYRWKPYPQRVLESLPNHYGPCVYWFEIRSYHGCKQVYDMVSKYRKLVKRRFPYQPPFSHPTSVLYVGEVGRNIKNRLRDHMGYCRNSNWQGLQLSHWANKEQLRLKFTCIYLQDSPLCFPTQWEDKIAEHLQPILGMHQFRGGWRSLMEQPEEYEYEMLSL